MTTASLIIVAVASLVGQTVAVIVSAGLTQRAAKRAQQAASQAQLATIEAAGNAALAQKAALNAARELVVAAKATDERLDHLKTVAEGTHTIVNNQRTAMLRLIADLRRQIADGSPGSEALRQAAEAAETDANKADG